MADENTSIPAGYELVTEENYVLDGTEHYAGIFDWQPVPYWWKNKSLKEVQAAVLRSDTKIARRKTVAEIKKQSV